MVAHVHGICVPDTSLVRGPWSLTGPLCSVGTGEPCSVRDTMDEPTTGRASARACTSPGNTVPDIHRSHPSPPSPASHSDLCGSTVSSSEFAYEQCVLWRRKKLGVGGGGSEQSPWEHSPCMGTREVIVRRRGDRQNSGGEPEGKPRYKTFDYPSSGPCSRQKSLESFLTPGQTWISQDTGPWAPVLSKRTSQL